MSGISRRCFFAHAAIGAASVMPVAGSALALPAGRNEEAGSRTLLLKDNAFRPADFDRLPLSWNQERLRQLRNDLAGRGLDGVILTNQYNIIYYTGLWHVTTERMLHVFVPTEDRPLVWFYPSIDRDLVHGWWYEDGEEYFDWLHAEGSAPNKGVIPEKLHGVDLWTWLLEGLKRRGYAGKNLAADRELKPSEQDAAAAILSRILPSVANVCLGMRMRKTPEELALARRAHGFLDQMHAYGRDLLLTEGRNLTDMDLRFMIERWGYHLIFSEIENDGTPHQAVGIDVGFYCRSGQSTSYPHPNQFRYNTIDPGSSLQMSSTCRVGGCGGETYRQFMFAPQSDIAKRLWTVNRDSCLLQKDLMRPGEACSEVARKIHEFQIKQGMEDYIYHRPAHGQGFPEGHQPPYIALGDDRVLEPGMCFSSEPGLYAPEHGVGSNFSDLFVVMPDGPAQQMSCVPWSEEWGWIKI